MDLDGSRARIGGHAVTPGDSEALWDWNLESDRIHVSPGWMALVGCEDHQVGSTPEGWFQRVHPEDRAKLLREIEVARAADAAAFECRYRLRHTNGTYRWMSCRGTVIRDNVGRAIRLTGSQWDVTVQMVTDPLTRLPNRFLLVDRISQSIERARRYKAFHFAVLLIELGRPASPGKSSGKANNDPLLTAVARRLETCLRLPEMMTNLRHNDLVARANGDHFAILLDGLKEITHAKVAADRILGELLNPFALGGREVRLSASIGIAVSATGYMTADEMLHDAETALHRAQVLGGSHCECFDTAILNSEQAELQLEGDFEAALQRREFDLFYQPIVSLASNEVLGFEALVRWRHPVLGMIAPSDFIPLAERTGFIVPLGYWILREACFRLREWTTCLPVSRDLSVSVNFSSEQWCDPAVIDQIGQALRDSGLEPRRLVLELTEGIAIANPATVTTLLMRLRATGVRISIDDFGTGFSSLAYLRQFPIDTLKIDRSFVRGLIANKANAEIVGGIISMSKQLGLQVVAEGIEHEDQCTQLRALKCDAGQGFLFSKPLDAYTAAEVLTVGLAPRPEAGHHATESRRRQTPLRQIWVRTKRFGAAHPRSCAAALMLLSSAVLALAFGGVRSALGGSPMPAADLTASPAVKTVATAAVPMLASKRAVEPPKDSSVAPGGGPAEPSPPRSSSPSSPPLSSPLSVAIEATSPASPRPLITQTASLDVVHLHRLGSCRGRLNVTREGIAFTSADDRDETFTLKYTEFLHALSDDTLTLKSATRTYRFKAGTASPESAVQFRNVGDTIARSRR